MERYRLLLFLSGIAFFFLFILFSLVVAKGKLDQFDFNTTVRLQDNISRRSDDVFSVFSLIGNFEVMFIVLIILFVVLRKFIAGVIAIFLFGMFHIIELYGKNFVDHFPPPEFLLRTKRFLEFPQFHVRAEFSYPSGHSGRAVFLSVIIIVVVLLSKKIPPPLKIIIIGVILAFDSTMLVSRIYLGEHWATDVIGGALLGISFGLFSSALMIRVNEGRGGIVRAKP
ncbi:MAG: phosphatase PAP2 family protein [Candidatus Levybacteria bacterium]|nr:phosphatase PAP2 family protein [Candidatus Levybacteria bacterium]